MYRGIHAMMHKLFAVSIVMDRPDHRSSIGSCVMGQWREECMTDRSLSKECQVRITCTHIHTHTHTHIHTHTHMREGRGCQEICVWLVERWEPTCVEVKLWRYSTGSVEMAVV